MPDEPDNKTAAADRDTGRGLETDLLVAVLAVLAIEAAGRLAFRAATGTGSSWTPGSPYPSGPGSDVSMGFVAALRVVQTAAAVLYVCVLRRRPLSTLGLGAKGAVPGVVAGLVFCALLAALLATWATVAPSVRWIPSVRAVLGGPPFEPGALPGFIVGMIAMIVVGPVAEELVFRGLVFGAVRRPFGVFAAIAASSCLFAAAHIGGQWPIFLAGGAAFAVLRARTGSLVGPLVAHAGGNGIILFFIMGSQHGIH